MRLAYVIDRCLTLTQQVIRWSPGKAFEPAQIPGVDGDLTGTTKVVHRGNSERARHFSPHGDAPAAISGHARQRIVADIVGQQSPGA